MMSQSRLTRVFHVVGLDSRLDYVGKTSKKLAMSRVVLKKKKQAPAGIATW